MFQKTVLPNGLRVVTSHAPYSPSISIAIFFGAGSRYETDEEAGSSHFIEHMCFKGTQRRPTSREISEAIEGVGGLINGGTDKELTIYWSKVARPHFPIALDVLADMLLNSKFESAEVEKERQVIVEEINMTMDSPPQWVSLLIDELLWPQQPLGRDVAGSRETVTSFTRERLRKIMSRLYVPSNAVVAVAGELEHGEIVARIADAFASWQGGPIPHWFSANDEQQDPRVKIAAKDTEQAHLCLALRGLSTRHPDRFAHDLLNAILGEGMSSRLFLQVREKLGLAYDIHSYVSHLLDSGSWVVYAGVQPQKVGEALSAIMAEIAALRDGIPEAEIAKTKEFLKGRLLLRLEDTRSVAGWLGAQELLLRRILTVDEVLALIDAITPQKLQEVAQSLIDPQKLSLAVVGPVNNDADLLGRLKL